MWQQTFLVLVLFILEVLMYWNSDLYGCYTHDCHTRCLLRLLREIRDISCLGKIKVNNVHSFSDDVWVWVRFAKFCMMTFDYTELPVFWWLTLSAWRPGLRFYPGWTLHSRSVGWKSGTRRMHPDLFLLTPCLTSNAQLERYESRPNVSLFWPNRHLLVPLEPALTSDLIPWPVDSIPLTSCSNCRKSKTDIWKFWTAKTKS